MECPPGQVRHDRYPDGCPKVPSEDDNLPCFTCNSTTNVITKSQRNAHGWKARCRECIENGRFGRFEHFARLEDDLASKLHSAVSSADIEKTVKLLQNGADPNGRRQLGMYDDTSGQWTFVQMENLTRSMPSFNLIHH